jgi:hypothetical protein
MEMVERDVDLSKFIFLDVNSFPEKNSCLSTLLSVKESSALPGWLALGKDLQTFLL